MSRSSKLDPLAFYFLLVLALFSLDNIHCQLISIKSVALLVFASALSLLFKCHSLPELVMPKIVISFLFHTALSLFLLLYLY